jgi:hypothetical protein
MFFIIALPKSPRGFFLTNIIPMALYYMATDRKFNFEYRIALYWLITKYPFSKILKNI